MTTTTVVGALPCRVDLLLYQGDDAYLDVVVTEPDGTASDLTGYTPAAQIRERPDSTDVLATWLASIDGNIIRLHLTHDQAANLATAGCWDVQITDAAGAVTTLAYGQCHVTREVTRPTTTAGQV